MPSFTVCLINCFGCFCNKHATTLEKNSECMKKCSYI